MLPESYLIDYTGLCMVSPVGMQHPNALIGGDLLNSYYLMLDFETNQIGINAPWVIISDPEAHADGSSYTLWIIFSILGGALLLALMIIGYFIRKRRALEESLNRMQSGS